MKPRAIAAAFGILILIGAAFYFYKMETAVVAPPSAVSGGSSQTKAVVAEAPRPASELKRAIISPAAPKGILPVAAVAHVAPAAALPPATPNPLDSEQQTSITIVTLWEGSEAPAQGTSVTLRGCIGSKAVEGWRKSAYTDAKGRVTMQFPESFDWLVVTTLQSMAPRLNPAYERRTGDKASMTTGLPPLTDPLVLHLTRGGRVFGTVRRADNGKPVAGATVFGTPQRSGNWSGTMVISRSAQGGEYVVDYLPAGGVMLGARGDGLYYDSKGQPDVTVAAGQEAGPHDIMMVPGATVKGLVTARRDGTPIAGATLTANVSGSGDQRQRPSAVSGRDGSYAIEGIPLGTSPRVTANFTGYAIEADTAQFGPDGIALLDFKMGSGGRLEATVVDQKKNPVPGAQIQLGGLLGGGGMDSSAMTDAQGHAALTNVSLAPDQRVYVTKPGFEMASGGEKPAFNGEGVAKVEYTLNKMESRNLTFVGTVSDAANQPLPGIQIAASGSFVNGQQPQNATTAADGTYTLGPVEFMANRPVSVRATGKGWAVNVKPAPAIEDESAPVRIDFTMEPGHWVAGTVVNEQKSPLAGIRVAVAFSGGAGMVVAGGSRAANVMAVSSLSGMALPSQNMATTKEDGKFRFEDLPNQTASVTAISPGASIPVSQQVPVDQETEIVIKSPGIIRGRVTDALTKQPVAQFTVSIRGEQRRTSDAPAQPFSPPDGKFTVLNVDRNQPNRLTVQSTGYSEFLQEHVQASDGQSPDSAPELALELTPAKPLSISLVDKVSGAPVAGASLIVGVLTSNSSLGMPWENLVRPGSNAMTNMQNLRTDASGAAVAYEGNEPSTILISAAGYPNTAVIPADRSKYAAGDRQLKIPLSHGGSISGVVRLDGQIAAGQRVALHPNNPQPGTIIASATVQTDASGQYRLTGIAAGAYSLNVMMRTGNADNNVISKRTQLAEGQDLTVNIGDDAGSSALFGFVTQGGKPAPATRISLMPAFDWEYTHFATISDANGEYKILGLRPGRYEVMSLASRTDMGGTISMDRPLSESVAVGPDPTQHDIDFKTANKVSAHLVFPPDFPALVRSSIRRADLLMQSGRVSGPPNQPGAGQIDRQVSGQVAGDRVVFTGFLQGSYRLRLSYIVAAPPSGQRGSTASEMIELPQSVTIDNLQGDVDLGDVAVPLPSAR